MIVGMARTASELYIGPFPAHVFVLKICTHKSHLTSHQEIDSRLVMANGMNDYWAQLTYSSRSLHLAKEKSKEEREPEVFVTL